MTDPVWSKSLTLETANGLIGCAKHAAVKQVTIRMTCEMGILQIVVRDESGFDLAAAHTSPLSSKFGLFSIRERMKTLGGSFDFESSPTQGTTGTLSLPIDLAHLPTHGSSLGAEA